MTHRAGREGDGKERDTQSRTGRSVTRSQGRTGRSVTQGRTGRSVTQSGQDGKERDAGQIRRTGQS